MSNRKPMSEETKKKIGDVNRGRKYSKEICEKLSRLRKGRIPWNKGKHGAYSEEHLKKMSECRKGILHTEEAKKRISEANKGRIISEDTRRKLSIANKGKKLTEEQLEVLRRISFKKGHKPWNKGKEGCFSEDTKRKMSEAHIGLKHTEETKRKISENNYGVSHRGEENPGWKGGRYLDNNGYIRTYCPDHPKAYSGMYVLEHRLVMEKYLGRYLEDSEIVHHIDENKLNNDINNLVIMTAGEHISLHKRKTLRRI